MVRYGLRLRISTRSELLQKPSTKGKHMGKTYRKEKPQHKKAREDDAAHKRVDHGHERTTARRQLNEAKYSWNEGQENDELGDGSPD